MNILIVCVLASIGLIMGSFAGAQVWRLRARQLIDDKQNGEPYDKQEYRALLPLSKVTTRSDRSRCLHCGHQLMIRDLIPLISWLSTRGKCRYCHTAIGAFEPIVEIATALAFVSVYIFWPFPLTTVAEWTIFVAWMAALVVLAILFAYDLKWLLLPDSCVIVLIALGVVVSAAQIIGADSQFGTTLSVLGGIATLSGVYGMLWLISNGRWIGFGDVKLGLGLALLLADWKLAFIALFAANFIGCIVVLPGLLTKKISRTSHVPFGPFLILGTVVALLFGAPIVVWYSSLII